MNTFTRVVMAELIEAIGIMAHRVGGRSIYRLSRGADARDGVQSFLEKRAPAYPGRGGADMPDFYSWREEPGYA